MPTAKHPLYFCRIKRKIMYYHVTSSLTVQLSCSSLTEFEFASAFWTTHTNMFERLGHCSALCELSIHMQMSMWLSGFRLDLKPFNHTYAHSLLHRKWNLMKFSTYFPSFHLFFLALIFPEKKIKNCSEGPKKCLDWGSNLCLSIRSEIYEISV